MRPMMPPMAGGVPAGMMPMQMPGGVIAGQPVAMQPAPVTQQPQPQNTNVQLDPFGAL